MYRSRGNLTLAFHGCDESIRDQIVNHQKTFKLSDNKYDWLGNGMYFWENNSQRALEWAEYTKDHPQNNKHHITKPAVLGAIVSLGYCLDLLDSDYLSELKTAYDTLATIRAQEGKEIEQNTCPKGNSEKLIHTLDCSVIEILHKMRKDINEHPYDSVRAAFIEGGELYPTSGFNEKNHIQICIRNPNCIKGYFIPRIPDESWGRI